MGKVFVVHEIYIDTGHGWMDDMKNTTYSVGALFK